MPHVSRAGSVSSATGHLPSPHDVSPISTRARRNVGTTETTPENESSASNLPLGQDYCGLESCSNNIILSVDSLQESLEKNLLCKACTGAACEKTCTDEAIGFVLYLKTHSNESLNGLDVEDIQAKYREYADRSRPIRDKPQQHLESTSTLNVGRSNGRALAQTIVCECKHDDETIHEFEVSPSMAKPEWRSSKETRSDAAIHCQVHSKLVIAIISFGMGKTEATTIAGFLDLESAHSFGHKRYRAIENDIGSTVIDISEEALNEALLHEIKLACEEQGISFDEWNAKTLEEKKADPLKLTVGVDMGWNQRSSGRQYNSPSGHGYLVGQLSQKPIDGIILSKKCSVCEEYERKKNKRKRDSTEEDEHDDSPKEHDCVRNFSPDDSSGSMEVLAARLLVEGLHSNRGIAVGAIVADEDSALRAKLKWSLQKKVDRGIMREADSKERVGETGQRSEVSERIQTQTKIQVHKGEAKECYDQQAA